MSVFGGLAKMGESALSFATAPLRTAGKIVGTGLETTGKVIGSLAEGDVRGAANSYVDGAKKQFGNVTGHFTGQADNVKGLVTGYGDYASSGLKFLGEPLITTAKLGANSLGSAANVGGSLLEGDVRGAANNWVDGAGRQLDILTQYPGRQLDNLIGK